MSNNKEWYNYLWIVTPVYLILGVFNILFAWIGLIFFMTPLLLAIFNKNKIYCNKYCDRGMFLQLLGKKLKFSRNRQTPSWLVSKYFRYGFMIFFLLMFLQSLWITFLVFKEIIEAKEVVKLFWTFKIGWNWANSTKEVSPWLVQFAYGFYSMMLTSNLIGIIFMILYKPRTWCTFCPMGTMTQLICKFHVKRENRKRS